MHHGDELAQHRTRNSEVQCANHSANLMSFLKAVPCSTAKDQILSWKTEFHNKVKTRLQLQMSGLPWGLLVMWAS